MVKKILVYLSPEKQCSLFDLVVAYDAGADAVIPYNNVKTDDVEDIIHGCCFTRHPRDLVHTAVFVGGYSLEKANEIASEALRVLERVPEYLRINIAVDPNGAYTTASACAAKIKSATKISGSNAVVLAGTGPVGPSTAALLAGMGARVALTSRHLDRARETAGKIEAGEVTAIKAGSEKEIARAVEKAAIVVSAGPPGVGLLSKTLWSRSKNIEVLADTNIVPPYGIEGVSPRDDGVVKSGKKCFGALAIGNLKMELHQRMIQQMFKEKNVLFDLNTVYGLCRSSLC